MTDSELTLLSTVAWVVATVALFMLLARWSTGASWGLASSLVNGIRSWTAGDDAAPRRTESSTSG